VLQSYGFEGIMEWILVYSMTKETPLIRVRIEIIQDSQDSDAGLLARLQSLGPVQPNPTLSNSSTFHFSPRPPLQHARNQTNSSSSSPLSQNSATPAPPRLQSLAPATAPAPNHDPSLIHTTFAPSPSNPLQTIFPSTSAHTDLKQGRNQIPALSLLTARHRLAEAAEHEFAQTGKANATGREFLDVMTLRQILALRDEKGVSALEIENSLGLKSGVVERLGGSGVVGVGS
jgi:hypothetical protein